MGKYQLLAETPEPDDLGALIEALQSLAYLATYEGLPLTAHLIGVAIESIHLGLGSDFTQPERSS
jgi:hypothetical protein